MTENNRATYQFNSLTLWILPCLQDNYIFIFKEMNSSQVIVIDPTDFHTVDSFLQEQNLTLNEIWITHHHADHIGGVEKLRNHYSASVRGHNQKLDRLPKLDIPLQSHFQWKLHEFEVTVYHLPGHTLDHIGYGLKNNTHSLLFSGDVLFGMGCGRVFEGSYEQMMQSLKIISNLPTNTLIFCSHEYTEKNLSFSLNEDPSNPAILSRKEKIQSLREQGKPTVPLLLDEELKTNLFLLALQSERPLEEFQRLREARNRF